MSTFQYSPEPSLPFWATLFTDNLDISPSAEPSASTGSGESSLESCQLLEASLDSMYDPLLNDTAHQGAVPSLPNNFSRLAAHNDIPRASLPNFMDPKAYRNIPPTTASPDVYLAPCPPETSFDFQCPFIPHGTFTGSRGRHRAPETTGGSGILSPDFRGPGDYVQSSPLVASGISPFQQPFAFPEAKKHQNTVFNHDDLLVPSGAEASSSRNNSPTHRSMVEGFKGRLNTSNNPSLDIGKKRIQTTPTTSVNWVTGSSSGRKPVKRQGWRRDLQGWKVIEASSSNPSPMPTVEVRADAKRCLDFASDPNNSASRAAKRARTTQTTSLPSTVGLNRPSPGRDYITRMGMCWYLPDHKSPAPGKATETTTRDSF